MRYSLLLATLALICGCTTVTLGPQKPPEYFVTPSVSFTQEASGSFESKVKRAVLPVLRSEPQVRAAYLVKIQYPDGALGTCLCLSPGSAESQRIAEAIGEAYGVVAEQGVYLDIMFIDGELLSSVERVADPFYVRP